jgi:hypothetical protein
MKLAVSDDRSFGKAEIPVTVPTNEGCRLDVGGIVLAKSFRRVGVGAADDFTELPGDYKPLISKGIEVTPTADTEFKQGGAFYFYFEKYNPLISAPSPPKVEAYVRVVDAKTGQIRNELQPLDATPYTKPGDPIIPIAGGIDISNLPPGSYRLEAQATDSAGNSTAWRATNFTIEDKSR